jgi:ATPase subunit of ABC transporter with duplicated ATPase domains
MSPVSTWARGTLGAWRTAYLPSLLQVTAMVISDDSGFLDRDCMNIFHCEFYLKLNSYVSRTSEFVLKREARERPRPILLRAPDVNMIVMVTSV